MRKPALPDNIPTPRIAVENELAVIGPAQMLDDMAGEWSVFANVNGELQRIGSSTAARVNNEPWVMRVNYNPLDELAGFEVIGYEPKSETYYHYIMTIGAPGIAQTGIWNANRNEFVWTTRQSSDTPSQLTERIEPGTIRHSWNSQTEMEQSTVEFEFQKEVRRPQTFWWPELFDNWIGRWSFQAQSRLGDGSEIENAGITIVGRIPNWPMLMRLSFNDSSRRLANAFLIVADTEDAPLRCYTIGEDGELIEQVGQISDSNGEIHVTWDATLVGGAQFHQIDRFRGDDQISVSTQFDDPAGDLNLNSTVEYWRAHAP